MSTNILETETFSITRFFGGQYRGVCYQINVAGSPGYVQLTRDEAVLLRSALTDELFGDPSEATPITPEDIEDRVYDPYPDRPAPATPSKENAPPPMKDVVKVRVAQYEARIPCGNCGHVHLGRCSVCDPPGCEQIVPPTAPAPEVQGTPTMPYGAEAQNFGAAPVGTPQKETPRFRIYNPGGENHGQLIEPTPHPAHETVPEGVQGKEPQMFDKYWSDENEFLLARFSCRCSVGSLCDSSPVHVSKFAKAVFARGEAAGRRSAITEIEKWAESQKSGLDEEATGKIMDWCAELQEKTK